MKGDSNVIFLVIAVIIGASILLLSLGILGKVKRGVDDMGPVEEQMVSLSQTCENWLYGDKYSAEAIINTYKLPEKMRPFSSAKSACGDEIEELAQKCITSTASGCAGEGIIKSDALELNQCTRTCLNIIEIFHLCEISCADSKLLCFESIVSNAGSSGLRGSLENLGLTSSQLERACEGRLV